MIFNSVQFIIFFLVILSIYYCVNRNRQNTLLLIASYFFYACWDWRFLSLILISTLIDFQCGKRIHRAKTQAIRKRYLIISLCVNLGMLGFFKYFNFFAESLETLGTSIGWQFDDVTLNIILPMGISFYTFQTMSYTIDIYRDKMRPTFRLRDFALFVAFFPQLVAGPIERASRFIPQITADRKITRRMIEEGLWLVLFGFFLKVFVADNLAKITNIAFSIDVPVSGDVALVGVYAFAFQIFGDFAGYSCIAIGISKLLGFNLMTNFRFPYFVTNPSEFWRHWHISLSSWLRDYLYIPLGGNRGSTFAIYRNLFLTMLIGGLWHGAAWTFVIWGAYQGTILVVHKMFGPLLNRLQFESKFKKKIWWIARVFFMFQITCIGWLIFRAESVDQIGDIMMNIISISSISPAGLYYLAQLVFFILFFWKSLFVFVRKRILM
ncbi:Probable poly(beta-D-mannuronate) O-acetylase [hydrothermal vent metagenome]|uniref:Probable poly(Beta-D-mannuronate) O-acetylase n=1 Tax=hydrothermal vent metagenome TaxID=652676 RepID=A0A3B1A2N1_9ZZZZ